MLSRLKGITILISSISLSYCNSKPIQQDKILQEIEKNLMFSSKVIETLNSSIYGRLKADSHDPKSQEIVSVLFKKAKVVKENADSTCRFIDLIRLKIADKIPDTVAVELSKILFKSLRHCTSKILSFDSSINNVFVNDTLVNFLKVDTNYNGGADFYTRYFHASNRITIIAVLNKFYNNIRLMENKVITYLGNSYCKIPVVYYSN